MSLAERVIEIVVWWTLLAAALTFAWHLFATPKKSTRRAVSVTSREQATKQATN